MPKWGNPQRWAELITFPFSSVLAAKTPRSRVNNRSSTTRPPPSLAGRGLILIHHCGLRELTVELRFFWTEAT